MRKVGVVGASGYAGAELLRLCASHPDLEVVFATGDTQAGTPIADLYPSLGAAYGGIDFAPFTPDLADGVDLVFTALPHGQSQHLATDLFARGCAIVDLAADF